MVTGRALGACGMALLIHCAVTIPLALLLTWGPGLRGATLLDFIGEVSDSARHFEVWILSFFGVVVSLVALNFWKTKLIAVIVALNLIFFLCCRPGFFKSRIVRKGILLEGQSLTVWGFSIFQPQPLQKGLRRGHEMSKLPRG
jgi:hypothetical protein